MNQVFQRSFSFTNGPPKAGSMPSPLLFQNEKSKRRTDSLKTQSLHDPKEENVLGTLDAALHRIAQRRQSEIAACSDQKSVHSMIEMRRAPRIVGQVLTMPRNKDNHVHRRIKSSDLNMFTIKWNKSTTKNRRESIEFEGDYDTDDWDSDADDPSESKPSRPLTTLEQALTFRSLAWNPCADDDDDEASQSSMSCSSVSSSISKSRGRRPRLIRSGSLKDTSAKAIEYMQHRSCLQQSLLKVKNQKPKRRHSSDEIDFDKLDKKSEETSSRRRSRQKSDRSNNGSSGTKSQDSSSHHRPLRRRSHDSTDESNNEKKSAEKPFNLDNIIQPTKRSQRGSSCSSKVSRTECQEESKSQSRNQCNVEKHSKVPRETSTNHLRKEKTNVKKSDALRSSKSSQHRRSSSIKTCDVHQSFSKKKDSSDTRQKEHHHHKSMKITDILATPNLMGNDNSPWKVARQYVALRTTNRV